MPVDIIATIGPSCHRGSVILQMAKAGMTSVRLNFSHESNRIHSARLKLARRLNETYNTSLNIMLDLKGHEVRVRGLKAPISLKSGERILLSNKQGDNRISLSNPALLKSLVPGMRILIDDGYVEMLVEKQSPGSVECIVVDDCVLKPGKSVSTEHLPEDRRLSEEDIKALVFASENSVDSVALSHVTDARAVKEASKMLNPGTELISKIEGPKGLENLDEIIKASDRIMVARGDLGINIPLEHVPRVQERILTACRNKRKPAIVATQLMESITTSKRPTRAEANDIYTAVSQGASGLVLSGETAVGMYPVKAVTWARKISETVTDHLEMPLNPQIM